MGYREDLTPKGTTTPRISDEIKLVISAALLALWITFLLWSSLASNLPAVPRFLGWDKLQHFLAYAVLMTFSGLFFKALFKNDRKGWFSGFFFSVFFGIMMEVAQGSLSTHRYADWKDVVANSLGAGGILLVILLKRNRVRSNKYAP